MSLFGEPDKPPLEERRLAQETAARDRELDIKEREVAAREREVKAKEAELQRSRWVNPMVIGLLVAAVGLFSNGIVASINNTATQTVERHRAQSNLVLEAIRTGDDPNKACQNLTFFVGLKLLDDQDNTIKNKCASAPTGAPSLPTGSSPPPPVSFNAALINTFSFKGKVVDSSTGEGIVGAFVNVVPTGLPGGVSVFSGGYSVVSGQGGFFSLQLPSLWQTATVSIHAASLGYSETTVEVPANQEVSIKLHRIM